MFKQVQLPKRAPIVYRPVSGGAATRVSGEVNAQPKTKPHRWPALLDLARGKPCLLKIPGVCAGGTDTTVACHSNRHSDGKAAHRKADDEKSVWGCRACHSWLDTDSKATAEQKSAAFAVAHVLQVTHWKVIANNARAPERERRAAAWALEMLKPTKN